MAANIVIQTEDGEEISLVFYGKDLLGICQEMISCLTENHGFERDCALVCAEKILSLLGLSYIGLLELEESRQQRGNNGRATAEALYL